MKYHNCNLIQFMFLLVITSLSAYDVKGQDVIPDSNQYHACFFEKYSFTVGTGIRHEPGEKGSGINGRLYYNIRENICFGPEISYTEKATSNQTEVNFVFHYIFEVFHFGIYPVIGAGVNNENDGEIDQNFNAFAGVGIHRNWHKLTFFSELDFSIYTDETLVTFGLMLTP